MLNTIKNNNVDGDLVVHDKNVININITKELEYDLGIINEIFSYIIQNKQRHIYRHKKDINVNEKISLNFKGHEETIDNYYKNAYTYIGLVEEIFSNLHTSDQEDIHGDILYHYECLKEHCSDNYKVLHELILLYIPPIKKRDPAYSRMARAIVLFFFEDCTWGTKTEEEKKKMLLGCD
jgi:hypothetical protein